MKIIDNKMKVNDLYLGIFLFFVQKLQDVVMFRKKLRVQKWRHFSSVHQQIAVLVE